MLSGYFLLRSTGRFLTGLRGTDACCDGSTKTFVRDGNVVWSGSRVAVVFTGRGLKRKNIATDAAKLAAASRIRVFRCLLRRL